MNDVVLELYLAVRCLANRFLYDEDGDVNIVSIVILIGIVVMLAGIFRTQISDLVTSLLDDIVETGKSNGAVK